MKTLTLMPASAEARHRVPDLALLRRDIETALGRDLVASFRHEHRHLGLQPFGDVDHLGGRRHLEVQLDVDHFAQAPHVVSRGCAAGLRADAR
jgi:hypothetical protein